MCLVWKTFLQKDKSNVSPFSAGIGRTGTLIAIDVALEQAARESVVDIPAIVTKMRNQRMKMVQNSVREALMMERMESLQELNFQLATVLLCNGS